MHRYSMLAAALLIAAAGPALAVEVSVPTAATFCSQADVGRGKVVWNDIEKFSDPSHRVDVKLTHTENRVLWCYNDSLHRADMPTDDKPAGPNFGITPEKALNVRLNVVPDPKDPSP